MRTPAGKECRYFYGDYYRGRNHEECRLLKDAGVSWQPRLCATCPVPGILQANACEHMVLTPKVQRPFLIMPAQVQINAYCRKTRRHVDQPQIGCGECHPLPPIFTGEPGDPDITA